MGRGFWILRKGASYPPLSEDSFSWHLWTLDILGFSVSVSEGHLLSTHSVPGFKNSEIGRSS